MIGEGSIAEDLSQNRKPDTYHIFMSILFHERERERERGFKNTIYNWHSTNN